MSDTKRKYDLLSKEKRQTAIQEIINHFETERNEEIGVVAASEILDFMLQLFGEDIYNKALDESRETVKQAFENLEVDLELLLNK